MRLAALGRPSMDTLRSPRNRWAPLSKAVRCGEERFSQLETIDKKTHMEGEGASGSTSAKSRLRENGTPDLDAHPNDSLIITSSASYKQYTYISFIFIYFFLSIGWLQHVKSQVHVIHSLQCRFSGLGQSLFPASQHVAPHKAGASHLWWQNSGRHRKARPRPIFWMVTPGVNHQFCQKWDEMGEIDLEIIP